MEEMKQKALEILSKLTLEEKVALQTGADSWHTVEVKRAGLPFVTMVDGPTGLRKCFDGKNTVPAVCFPTASAMACSFDRELIGEVGGAMAAQCKAQDVHILLAPSVNIKRNVLCGRNFEYYSEDPYLSGQMGAAFVKGVQNNGVGACVKHFAANNTESGRTATNSVVDERALYEIYLSAFETVIKEAKPVCLMSAYNMLNGTYCAENKVLLDILREKFGFDGLVMTDWWANNDRIAGIKAGTDLEMPKVDTDIVKKALLSGELDEKTLDARVIRVIELVLNTKDIDTAKADFDRQHLLASRAAAESMVLLKNENHLLPLSKTQKVAVIGHFAKEPHIQGGGSARVNPTKVDHLIQILEEQGAAFVFAEGYKAKGTEASQKLLKEAVALAKACEKVVLVAGTGYYEEGEGYDREDMNLPANQTTLIKAVSAANKNTVVVLQCGGAVAMPWKDDVRGILLNHLAGQAGSRALYDVIYGKKNPCGRLSETYIKSERDLASFQNYGGQNRHILYGESIYIGYRYYNKAKTEINYPFGYGLSYTDFAYGDIRLSYAEISKNDSVTVRLNIKNTGSCGGADVVQVYIRCKCGGIFRADKELKGFQKVYLRAGESKEIKIDLPPRAFQFYDAGSGEWQTDGGAYEIIVAKNAVDFIKTFALNILGETLSEDRSQTLPAYYNLEKGFRYDRVQFELLYGGALPVETKAVRPFDLNTMCCETVGYGTGRLINGFLQFAGKRIKNREISLYATRAIPMSPIRNSIMGTPFTLDFAYSVLNVFNGHLIRGLKGMLKSIRKNKRKNK